MVTDEKKEENTLKFVQLSDTHLLRRRPTPGKKVYDPALVTDDGTKLKAALRAAATHPQRPDLFFLTGDLVHEGTSDDYRYLHELLDECCDGIPYYLCLGNHDRHQAFYEGFLGESERTGPYFYSALQDGLRIIALDTSPKDGMAVGALPEEQLAYLRQELQAPAPKGSIVILHHPPVGNVLAGEGNLFVGLMEHISPLRPELCEAIRGSDVKAVLSGHTHFTSYIYREGVFYATAASTVCSGDNTASGDMVMVESSSFLVGEIGEEDVSFGVESMNPGRQIIAEITNEMIEKNEDSGNRLTEWRRTN
jgi:3',5'-cyclic AMP phosphodiesterase CpdA